MVQAATTHRIVPVSDWAATQEAIYDEPSTSHSHSHSHSHSRAHHPPVRQDTMTMATVDDITPGEPRLRSMSLSLPWRHRRKSSLFHPEDLIPPSRLCDLSLEHHTGAGSGSNTSSDKRRRASGGALDHIMASASHMYGDGYEQGEVVLQPPPKGKNAIKGMIRRASVSIRGFMPRRTSVGTSTGEEHHPRRLLRTSHAHSHSHGAFAAIDDELESSSSSTAARRPSTAHSSTWRRLRQAASFRHSRVLYGGHPNLETIESPRETSFNIPPMPIPAPNGGPGMSSGPPVIPPNTGGAARAAAAAAYQSEVQQRHWLYPEECQNDRESGIGIAITSTESEGAGERSDLDGGVVVDDDALQGLQEGVALGISKVDFVSRLPAELAIAILAHLDAVGLATAARVCKSWSLVVNNQHIWRESFLREKTSTYATSGPVKPGTGLGVPAVRPENDWKQIYRVKQELDRRWRDGKSRPVYLNGHSDSIYCLQFDESKIITGSRDKTIRIWDMHTLACRYVIGPPEVIHDPALLYDEDGQPTHYSTTENNTRGASSTPATMSFPMHHKASILCLQYDDRILVTGSSDASCIVYSVRSGYRPVRRLRHHSAAVLDLCFDDRHIVTCSKDISICVWDRETGTLLKQLRGHSGPVNAVQMRGNTVVSCSGDFRVKLWNIETGRAIREFQGHTKGLACSQFSEDGRYVASAGNDRVIRVWDANTGECVREMKAHENLVRSLHIDSVSGRLVSGSYDTDIKVFEMETGRQLLDFPRWHASWVLSAKSDYRRIISTGQDPKILVMDFGAGVEGIEMLESGDSREVEEVTYEDDVVDEGEGGVESYI